MTSLDDSMANVIEQTRARILHALEVFPFISGSMLHQALGTSTSIDLWKPLLAQLIEEAKVTKTEVSSRSVSGRAQSYTIYHLPKHPYVYAQV